MKKRFSCPVRTILIILVSCWIAVFGTASTAAPQAEAVRAKDASPYRSQQKIVAKLIQKDFIPDADLTKSVWEKAAKVQMKFVRTGELPPREAETQVAARWTPTHVYFAFWAAYTKLSVFTGEDVTAERMQLWERAVVEIFVNPFPEHLKNYWEFEVSPNNQWVDLSIDLDKKPIFDPSWNSGFQHATRVDEAQKTWYCEIRIPVAAMGVPKIEPGAAWRINFYRSDGPTGDRQPRSQAWNPTFSSTFHVPECFGIIRFEK